MKRFVALFLMFALSISSLSTAYSVPIDGRIFSDPISNTYVSPPDGAALISNLNFTDLPSNFEVKESITRSGALNMIKGYDRTFNPNGIVSNQEAIAFVIRAIGLENLAQQRAILVQAQMPENSPLRTLWSIGYLNVAVDIGLITQQQYTNALEADQTILDPNTEFLREAGARKENLADWLVRGLEFVNPLTFASAATEQNIFKSADWDNLSPEYVQSMEKVLRVGMMKGDESGNLNPKGVVNRAQMAQILKNMDNTYYNIQGILKKTGTVAGIKDSQTATTNAGTVTRDVYIRTQTGNVDVLRYEVNNTSYPASGERNTVVFKDGSITGLTALSEGDSVEYLVRVANSTNLYVQVLGSTPEVKTVSGILKKLDLPNGKVTISTPADPKTNNPGKEYTYHLGEGLYGVDVAQRAANNIQTIEQIVQPEPIPTTAPNITTQETEWLYFNGKKRKVSELPLGSAVSLDLKNNIVEAINYLGEISLVTEQRGIVIENNTNLGYLTFIDNRGNEVTKYYYNNDIKVEKQQSYDADDEIGYIDEVFPNFKYDPRDTLISEVEAGDIVFMRFDPNDNDTIINISASTNYIMRYGKIKEFNVNGNHATIVVEYENKQTSWFDVPNTVFVSRDGRPIDFSDVKVGDWTKLLVNRAIIAPGNFMESVKEMIIEGDEHFISTIIKGQLTSIDPIQNQLKIQNAQSLLKTGWGNYKNVEKYNIAGNDIEYFYEGKRISLDYATQYLKRSNGEVYIALENNYAGEKVKRVTFRPNRDELLSPDKVLNSDGNGNFSILSNNGTISTDAGTIVRKNGRLVDGGSISIPDYAVVSLNGQNKAAVVDIFDAPNTSGVIIITGRVLKVNDGKSFVVKSMSSLNANEWSYAPIQREFTIDYNTLFLNADGYVANDTFLGYGDDSVINKVYYVVTNGTHADVVVDAPYANKSLRGTVYKNEEGVISIKDVTYLEEKTGKWKAISTTNNTATVNVGSNTIIIKNNEFTTAKSLTNGDQIKIMTDKLPDKLVSGIAVDGYILLVEK